LTRNQIFYWSQTLAKIKPEFKTSGRQYFEIHGILDFRLIYELQLMGLSPKTIQKIVWSYKKPKIWSWFSERIIKPVYFQDQKKYEIGGLFFIIVFSECLAEKSDGKPWGPNYGYYVGTEEDGREAIFDLNRKGPLCPTDRMKSALVVNLLKIIKDVEEKMGEKLEKSK
jgi:hypothetical protein